MKQFALFLIRCYKVLSSALSARCRFQPSCSTYAYQAIEIYGFFKGSFLAFKRIMRCHPFCDGGLDPVPLSENKVKSNKQKDLNKEGYEIPEVPQHQKGEKPAGNLNE